MDVYCYKHLPWVFHPIIGVACVAEFPQLIFHPAPHSSPERHPSAPGNSFWAGAEFWGPATTVL